MSTDKFRCLGVMAPERLAEFPDVPTFVEQGVDWSLAGWRGLALPRGVPPERVAVLHDAIRRVVQGEAFQTFMRTRRFDASYQPASEFARTLREADETLGALLSTQFSDLAPDRYGPLYFPSLIGLVFAVALIALIAGGVRRAAARKGPRAGSAPASRPSARAAVHVAAAVAFVVIFALCVEPLGYVLTTTCLLAALLLALGSRTLPSAVISVVFAAASYEVFGTLFKLPLPRGIFGW